MRLQPIVERLSTIRALVTTGGGLEFLSLKQLPSRLPAGYGVAGDESATLSLRANPVIDQKVTSTFDIYLIIPLGRDVAKGVSEAAHDLEDAVKDCFIGWTHPDATAPSQFVSAATASVDGTALCRVLRFTTSYHIRKAP